MPPILLYEGRLGAGKSSKMKRSVFDKKGCHLYVVSRKKLVEEVYRDLNALQTPRTNLHAFTSKEGRRGNPVTKQISDCAALYNPDVDRACIIVTHAAFLMLDLACFTDWHLHLDEIIANAVMSGSLHSPVMWSGLAALFELEPVTNSLSRLRSRPEIKLQDVVADSRLTDADRNLFQRALSRTPVLIEANTMEDIGQRGCSWYSIWTLDQANGFASIQVAASDFADSLMHIFSTQELVVETIDHPPSRARISIKYFDAGGASCSADYWLTGEGRANLKLAAEFISLNGGADYWTSNNNIEGFLKPLMPTTSPRRKDLREPSDGLWVPPMQEGTNDFRACTSCAMFLSGKAQAHERVYERVDARVTMQAITESRESSMQYQFAGRGAPRMLDFEGVFTIYVWDRRQAQRLSAKFLRYYPSTAVEHIAVDGFVDRVRKSSGPVAKYSTPEDRQIAVRQQNRLRQQRLRERRQASKDQGFLLPRKPLR